MTNRLRSQGDTAKSFAKPIGQPSATPSATPSAKPSGRTAWAIRTDENKSPLEQILGGLGFDSVEVFDAFHIPREPPPESRVPSVVFFQMGRNTNGFYRTIHDISVRLAPTPLIVLSDSADVATAVRSVKAGAFDYLVVPIEESRLEQSLRHALSQVMDFEPGDFCSGCASRDVCSLERDRGALHAFLSNRKAIDPCEVAALNGRSYPFIHASHAMQEIETIAHRLADSDLTVLVRGESGVGKEVVARYIHRCSTRREAPFVKINCAAIPESLLESELFGFEKGAFTGATRRKPGKFDEANGGTIFLDEISEMRPSLQAKLLHVLQDKEFSRLGGTGSTRVNVCVLAATNADLERAVEDGCFREDLYFRLKVVDLYIPPLRERPEEIRLFMDYFLCSHCRRYQKPPLSISENLVQDLLRYHWPGNIRELENAMKRIVVLGEDMVAKEFHKDETPVVDATPNRQQPVAPVNGKPSVHYSNLRKAANDAALVAERTLILRALRRTGWNRKEASSLLGVSYKTVRTKIKKYGLAEV